MNALQAAPSAVFDDLGLAPAVLQALAAVGYEAPTPIQAATIPALLSGADVLGQAQTGTGKTAAFALPILSRLELSQREPQALVMVPTRELAIQVAEAFKKYASHLPGFHVLPIYGGQSYTPQLMGLKRGAHVIVGTPGRIMDHLDRGALTLQGVRFVVLDEADEMLAMGFVDAMDAILSKVPSPRQVALFSATMAPAIRRIAQRHLHTPREITIRGKTTTAANTRQRYWLVSGMHKLDALTRILEVLSFDGMLVFARTKLATIELAEKLQARGFAAAALNGDMQQAERERTVAQLKAGQIDILVATDIAARGLDVERISHVVNYDVPHDTESYIHRIGRTGRAGRSGEAILFIAPRERNMLHLIERATRQPIEAMELPTIADVNATRVAKFKRRVSAAIEAGLPDIYRARNWRRWPRRWRHSHRVRRRWCSVSTPNRLDHARSSRPATTGVTDLNGRAPQARRHEGAPVALARRIPTAWMWAVFTVCRPATSSARSPTKPASTARKSTASRCWRITVWCACRPACRPTFLNASRACACAAGRSPSRAWRGAARAPSASHAANEHSASDPKAATRFAGRRHGLGDPRRPAARERSLGSPRYRH